MAVQGRAQRGRTQRLLQGFNALVEQGLRAVFGRESQAVGLHAQTASLIDRLGITFQGVRQVEAGKHADQRDTDDHHEGHQRIEHDRVTGGERLAFG